MGYDSYDVNETGDVPLEDAQIYYGVGNPNTTGVGLSRTNLCIDYML